MGAGLTAVPFSSAVLPQDTASLTVKASKQGRQQLQLVVPSGWCWPVLCSAPQPP